MDFTSIVISSGALKVISTIGCIKYLEEHNRLLSLKNYVGTSAGAVMCFFMVLGYKSSEIQAFLEENLYDSNISQFDISQVFNILTNYGVSDGNNMIEMFQRILYKKMKRRDITFLELSKAVGKNLVICVTNLTQERPEFLCLDTHPDMSVIQALRASCSIPFLFYPVKIGDDIYLDGALSNNFPMNYFKENKLKDILGLNIIQTGYQDTSDFFSFSLFMVFSLVYKLNKYVCDDKDRNIVTIDIEDTEWFSLKTFQINFSKDMLRSYIDIGYQLIKSKFDQ